MIELALIGGCVLLALLSLLDYFKLTALAFALTIVAVWYGAGAWAGAGWLVLLLGLTLYQWVQSIRDRRDLSRAFREGALAGIEAGIYSGMAAGLTAALREEEPYG